MIKIVASDFKILIIIKTMLLKVPYRINYNNYVMLKHLVHLIILNLNGSCNFNRSIDLLSVYFASIMLAFCLCFLYTSVPSKTGHSLTTVSSVALEIY